MAKEFLNLALVRPEVLEVLAKDSNVDHRVRKIIEQVHNELTLIGQRTQEQQDALSRLYLYTIWKVDTTLTAIEMMKVLRSPIAPAAELDKIEQILRKRYLEQMDQIAHAGSLKVVEKSK